MPSSAISTQNFTIKTDVQVTYPTIVCPIIATLTPSAAYISLSSNIISIDAALIQIPTDYGANPFTITVASSNFPGTLLSETYSFNVIITCAVSSLTITSQALDTPYTLG
jgi:hypothetical protein